MEEVKNTKATPQMLAIMIGVMAGELYLSPENRNPPNVFEVLLFSSIEILSEMKNKLPEYYPEFETEYFNEIENFAIKQGIKENIKGDFNEFVDSRFQLYGNEFYHLLQNSDVLPTKIAYHFFKEPLTNISSDLTDILTVLELKLKIERSVNSNMIAKSIDKIISDLNLKEKIKQSTEQNLQLNKRYSPYEDLIETCSTDIKFQQEIKWFINNENHYDLFGNAKINPSIMYLYNCKWILKLFYPFYNTFILNKSDEIKKNFYNSFFELIYDKLEKSKEAIFIDRDLPQNQNYEGFEIFRDNVLLFEMYLSDIISLIENSSLPKNSIQKLKSTSTFQDKEGEKTSKKTKEGCYIATMVYRDYEHPQVVILRNYRDNVLLKSKLGRLFVKIYYFISPSLVSKLKHHQKTNKFIKNRLDKIIDNIKQKKY